MTSTSKNVRKDHFVKFYEADSYLLDTLREYVDTKDLVIAIVTPQHKEALELFFKGRKNFILFDAEDTLSQFMINSIPNKKLFNQLLGGVMKEALKSGEVKAFGDMVSILWAKGNKVGAIRLEKLWNGLGKTYDFTMFCAYPMGGFGKIINRKSISELTDIMDEHTWADLKKN